MKHVLVDFQTHLSAGVPSLRATSALLSSRRERVTLLALPGTLDDESAKRIYQLLGYSV